MKLPRCVNMVKDRHGKVRFRFRKVGLPSRYLPNPIDHNFQEEYEKCMHGLAVGTCENDSSLRILKGVQVVYFIGSDLPFVKIGTTFNIFERLRTLQTGNPVGLRVLTYRHGGQQIERAYHCRFARHKAQGEWFHLHPEILTEISKINSDAVQPPLVQPSR